MENLKQIPNEWNNKPNWIHGDSENLSVLVDKNRNYDMIFSCPPYYDLEKYSDEQGELSALETYEEFLDKYNSIISECVYRLQDNRFAVFVVSDIRDKKGFYRNLVGDTKSAFINNDMELYNDIIFLTAIGGLPLRCGIPFKKYRKVGRAHQNILVFYKGDVKKIPDIFGEKILVNNGL